LTLVGFGVILLVPLGAAALPDSVRQVEVAAALAGALVTWSAAFVAAIREGRVAMKERKAGYTTLYGMHYEYWQLDPRTGAVLRRPGDREAKAPTSD
jgi:hypothetical protein